MVNWLNYLDNNTGEVPAPKKTAPPRPIVKRVEPSNDANTDFALDQMRIIDGRADTHGNSAKTDQFAKQARFMQSFETLVEKDAIPQKGYAYNDLSDEELKTYFSWRKKAKTNEITIAPLPFVSIYLEELANLCGVQSNTEAITAMLSFWKKAHAINPEVDPICQLIIHDMYVSRETKLDYMNNIVAEYPSNVIDSELVITDILKENYANAISFLIKNSNYEINNSDFYKNNKIKFSKILVAVLHGLNNYFSDYNVCFKELICGKKESAEYKVFDKYLIRVEPACRENTVITDKFEYKYSGNGFYNVTKFSNTVFSSMLIGYILKFTEAELRRITRQKPMENIVFSKIFEMNSPDTAIMNLITCDNFINCIKLTVQNAYLNDVAEKQQESTENSSIYTRIHSFTMPSNTFSREETEPYFDYRAIKFHLQAEKYFQYEDDYNKKELIDTDITPVYTDLTENQLKSYFTWRKYAKRKQYIATQYAFVLMYLAELFNLVGESSPESALSTIINFWKEYRQLDRNIDNDLPNWIKDFYLHYNLKTDYAELLKEIGSLPADDSTCIAEIVNHNYDNKTYFLDNHSSYHFINSPYSRHLLFTFDEVLPSVFIAVEKYFENNGFNFGNILLGDNETDSYWKPFKNSAVEIKKIGNNRTVKISDYDEYTYIDGIWHRTFKNLSNNASVIIGYITRTTESQLRHHTNFKTALKSDLTSLTRAVKNHPAYENVLLSENLEQVIVEAVNEYISTHKQLKNYFNISVDARPEADEIKPVSVDLSKLSAIRTAANDIQEQLVIEDEEYTDIAEAAAVKEVNKTETISASQAETTTDDNPLSTIQRQCLTAVLSQENVRKKLTEIASAKGMLPEAILESINEALYDIFNDNIIVTDDDEPYIYEDYVEEAKAYGE